MLFHKMGGIQVQQGFFSSGKKYILSEILCMGKINYDLFLVEEKIQAKKNSCIFKPNGDESGN